MFVKEFFFSFSLLAFTGILMLLGSVLLIDAMRRFILDIYKAIRPKAVVQVVLKPALKNPEEKIPPLEQVA
jgi:hypothetical protein